MNLTKVFRGQSRLFSKVGAASLSQASRMLYAALVAGMLWSERDPHSIGVWYGVVAWVGLATLCDMGVSLTIVSRAQSLVARTDQVIILRAEVKRLLFRLYIASAFVGILLLIGYYSVSLPAAKISWFGLAAGAYVGTVSNIVAGTLSSILQSSGGWTESHQKAAVAYAVVIILALALVAADVNYIAAVAASQGSFGVVWLILLLRRFRVAPDSVSGADCAKISINRKFVFSGIVSLCAQRLPLFSAAALMPPERLGEFGKYYQLMAVVVGGFFFAANGLANKVIGDYNRGGAIDSSIAENRGLLLVGIVSGGGASLAVVVLVNVASWMGWIAEIKMLSGVQQVAIALAATSDAILYTCLPIACHIVNNLTWSRIIILLLVLSAPFLLGIVARNIFIEMRMISSMLMSTAVLWTAREAFATKCK